MNQQNWMNRQFLPGTNRFTYWLKTPLGWLLVGIVGCALLALALAPQMWLVFGLLVTLFVIGTVWPWLAMQAVSCELRFSRKRCPENSVVQVHLLITNRFWFPVWGLTVEKGFFQKQTDDPDSEIAIALARIPAASATRFDWDFEPLLRGLYPTVTPELSCGFPFGLWFAKRKIVDSRELIVWPETFRLGSIPPARGTNQLVSETHVDRSGSVGDRIGVRPFRDGDSLRLVRWPQTARLGQLIVSEQQSPARQKVTVTIEPVTTRNRDQKNPRNDVEDCIRVGASICGEFHAHGYVVLCRFAGNECLIDARDSAFRQFMDQLAKTNFEDGPLETVREWLPQQSEVNFLVTNSPDRFRQLPGSRSGAQVHSVLVRAGSDDSKETQQVADSTAWIKLNSGEKLRSEFPRQWVIGCQSSWQVNG